MSSQSPREKLIFSPGQFDRWTSLNDSIMGGSSNASCKILDSGLLLEGDLIEEGGGFVSCRSPILSPPLNLSQYRGLKVDLDGAGRTLKIAIKARNRFIGMSGFFERGLCWVAAIPTNVSGTTSIHIPFNILKPTIRAKKVPLPVPFNSRAITQFQLLHSKFGLPGEINAGFKPGFIQIHLRSISVFT